jgi:hypothetical protein
MVFVVWIVCGGCFRLTQDVDKPVGIKRQPDHGANRRAQIHREVT